MDRPARCRARMTARRAKALFSLCTALVLAGAALLVVLVCLDNVSALQPAAPVASLSLAIQREELLRVRLTHDGDSTPWTWTPDGQGLLVRRSGQIVDQ